jgi:signal transduction histidine kinase
MRHYTTIGKFFPQLRTNLLDTSDAEQQHQQYEQPLEADPQQLAYHFLVHPGKNSLYAGEKVAPDAPELQLPLMLHPTDTAALMEQLIRKEALSDPSPIHVQGRLQALDGVSWIHCQLKVHSLPATYQQLYGWMVYAYVINTTPEVTGETTGEQVLHILSQLYNAGVWRYYPRDEILEVDSALQKLLNLEKRRLPIQEWLDHIHPEDISRLLKKVFNAQRKQGLFQLNIRYQSAVSRHYRYLALSAGAFSDNEGTVYITGLCFDGTLQQRLQSKNQLNKTFLDEAQVLGNIGCFEWLPEENQLQATPQLKQLAGLSQEEEFTLEFLKSSMGAADYAALQHTYEGFLDGEQTQELTLKFKNATGTLKTLWMRAKASYEQANMVSLIGIVQDISDREDQRTQLQAKDKLIGGFLRSLPVGIIAINKKQQIISVVGTGLKDAGLDRRKLIGKCMSVQLPELVEPIRAVFESRSPANFMTEHSRFQGAETSASSYFFNHFYYDEERELAIGFMLDITKQKRAEQSVQYLSQLEQRYQLMDTFVHAVAHDLRSPVVNLDMLLSFFTKDSSPEEQTKYVAAMTNGIQHLKRTLDALIEILRIEKDSTVIAEEIDIQQLIAELEEEYGEKLLQSEGSLHTYLQCGEIYYNKAYLSSILRNLISNAIKYSYPGRAPHINICTERKGDIVLLLVQDNGMGMDLKRWGHLLFQPFKRLNNHRNGTGIGLHLIKQIIEKNGGKIKVKSQPGEGTTFFCFLRPYR